MLLLDDVHDIFRGGLLKQRHVLALIRKLADELAMPIVTAGTQEAVAALHTDDQVTTRFDPIPLLPWRKGARLAQLLVDLEGTIPLPEPSRLASPELGPVIIAHTTETIGSIWHLLKLAGVLAIKRKLPRIDRKLLEEAGKMAPPDWSGLAGEI